MSDPLALVPLAAAAGGGTIDSLDARQLVAAGITMLQRCAPLVREMARGRAALMLPDSPAYLVALAACEGRGAVLLDPESSAAEVERQIYATNTRAVFTIERLGERIAGSVPRVYLDAAPGHASFVHGAECRVVDLGSHFGFAIAGEGDIEGRDEEAVIARDMGSGDLWAFSHRALLAGARAVGAKAAFTREDRVLAAAPFFDAIVLVASLVAPLLAGADVTAVPRLVRDDLAERLRLTRATVLVGVPEVYEAILDSLRRERGRLQAPELRMALIIGAAAQPQLEAEWQRATGVELRQLGSVPGLTAHPLSLLQDFNE